jgi:antiseptic resistance protein
MTKRQRWSALALLSAGLVMIAIDMTILFIALPQLTAELRSTTTEQLWIVDIYPLILAGLLIPMSAVADRIGRRKALLIGFTLFGLVSLLVLFAASSAMVIGLRAMLGVAGALIMPTTLSMVRSIFTDPMERTRALAIWSMFAEVGAIIGPLVGGTLLEFFSWHAAFLINARGRRGSHSGPDTPARSPRPQPAPLGFSRRRLFHRRHDRHRVGHQKCRKTQLG